jgi:glycolate oxidase iron-sulfur subunit
VPVVHTVELLDWATGGPKPDALKDVEATMPDAVREGRSAVTA